MDSESCCSCVYFPCPQESSSDSDSGEEPPLPPGLMPVKNDGRIRETQRIQTPAASSECLLGVSLREALRQPQLSIRKQLFCMTGYNITMQPDTRVRGTREHYNLYAILEVRAVGKGEVQIRGVDSGLFLAMSRKGRLYGELNIRMKCDPKSKEMKGLFSVVCGKHGIYAEECSHTGFPAHRNRKPDQYKENTVFVETLSGAFYNYLSRKYAHHGWYVGIKKSGKPKRAHKTEYGQRAVQFLPRHPYPLG